MLAMVVSALTALIYTGVYGQIALALVISLPLLFASAFAMSVSPRQALTPQGEAYAGQVAGLMRYMEDFSEFGDRGVFDTVLWGRYMVYAAAFGISDKLMEQMERAYPQLADPEWANVHTSNDSLVYWSARRRATRARGGAFGIHGMHAGGSFSSMVSNSFSSVGSTIRDAMPQSSSSGSRSGSRSSGGGGVLRAVGRSDRWSPTASRRWARRCTVGARALFCVAMKKWELQLPLFAYIPSNTFHFLPRRKKVSEVPVVVVGFFGLAHHI